MNAIEITGVTKTLSQKNGKETVKTEVLRGVDIRFEVGEKAGVIGPSGCGKTTLLRLINRLLDPDGGTVEVLGKRTADWDPLQLRRRVALVLQRPAVFDGTISENVLYPFTCSRLKQPDNDEIAEWLEYVELGNIPIDRPASSLSVGQQQRLCLARALILDPDILMLDETTSALDPLIAGKILDKIYKRCDEGMTLIHVTHEPAKLRKLDRIVLLEDGLVAEQSKPNDFLSGPKSEAGRVYVGGII